VQSGNTLDKNNGKDRIVRVAGAKTVKKTIKKKAKETDKIPGAGRAKKVIKVKLKEKPKKNKNRGPCIYLDWSTKGGSPNSNKRHNTYRADISINGRRYRKRDKNKKKLEMWINALLRGHTA